MHTYEPDERSTHERGRSIVDDLLSSDGPKVKVPDGAVNLFPRKFGPKILAVDHGTKILKAAVGLKMSEAEAMRFVSRNTTIPVPEVFGAYVEDGVGYILMSRIEGERLGRVWKRWDSERRAVAVGQLKDYMAQLGNLHGDFYGALWHRPCEDIFFAHFPFKPAKVSYGPYRCRAEYIDGIVRALELSRPTPVLYPTDLAIVDKLRATLDDAIVFCHGDLNSLNILVDEATGRITGIIDWEAAGFSIHGRDYHWARTQAMNPTWASALDDIFTTAERRPFDLLQELDDALVLHVGM